MNNTLATLPKTLLTVTGNPKTDKATALGFPTAVLHLSPHTRAGVGNMCPNATKECVAVCINVTGRGGIYKRGETTNAIQEARKARTVWYRLDQVAFLARLNREIANHVRRVSKASSGAQACVRLNGTSDEPWETVGVVQAFPEVTFYDYSKSIGRVLRYLDWRTLRESVTIGGHAESRRALQRTAKDKHPWPTNYHLALSYTGEPRNVAACRTVLARGGTVAAIFHPEAPARFLGAPVVNGDDDDLVFRSRGVVRALRPKGPARKLARTGRGRFIVDTRGLLRADGTVIS